MKTSFCNFAGLCYEAFTISFLFCRYYYDKNIMTKVHGKRYAYKFDFQGLAASLQPQPDHAPYSYARDMHYMPAGYPYPQPMPPQHMHPRGMGNKAGFRAHAPSAMAAYPPHTTGLPQEPHPYPTWSSPTTPTIGYPGVPHSNQSLPQTSYYN